MVPGVDLNINPKVWKEYKKFCIDIGESASGRVERFMLEDMKRNKK